MSDLYILDWKSSYDAKVVNNLFDFFRPSYTIPSGVVNGIKIVHPMFRGYAQQVWS